MKDNMTLVREKPIGLGGVLQFWTSPNRSDVEGWGWSEAARFKDGVWTNTKTVTTYSANPNRGELSG